MWCSLLFKFQLLRLKLTFKTTLNEITFLAVFLTLFHMLPWFTASNSLDSVNNGSKLLCPIEQFINDMQICTTTTPSLFLEISSAFLTKFDKRLWYLSEHLVIFALFSDPTFSTKKQKMAEELLKYQCDQGFPSNTKSPANACSSTTDSNS